VLKRSASYGPELLIHRNTMFPPGSGRSPTRMSGRHHLDAEGIDRSAPFPV
jgi:hypothetical protein